MMISAIKPRVCTHPIQGRGLPNPGRHDSVWLLVAVPAAVAARLARPPVESGTYSQLPPPQILGVPILRIPNPKSPNTRNPKSRIPKSSESQIHRIQNPKPPKPHNTKYVF